MMHLILAVGLILLLLYVAALYESAALALLAFLLLGLVLGSYILIFWRMAAIDVELSIPMSLASCGQPTGVRFTVRTKRKSCGKTPLRVLVEGRQLPGKRKKRIWLRLYAPAFGEERVRKDVTMHCAGGYEYRLRRVRIYDWTGWFYLTRWMEQSATTLLLPKVHEFPVQLSGAVKNFFGESDVYDDLRGGSDTSEVFQIREYVPGDRLQNIHWKLSAKSEELMVREHSQTKGCPIVLLLGTKGIEKQKPMMRDRFLQLAAAISFSLVDADCPHIVSWFDGTEGEPVRMRVDDEEGFYEWQMRYLIARTKGADTDVEAAYAKKYASEVCLHRLRIEPELSLYLDGSLWKRFSKKGSLETELESLQLLL